MSHQPQVQEDGSLQSGLRLSGAPEIETWSQYEWVPVHSPIFVALTVFTALHFAVAAALYWRRRRFFPISGQAHLFVILTMVGILTDCLGTTIQGALGHRVHCLQVVPLNYGGVLLAGNAFMVRAWRVWYKYLFCEERVSGDKSRRWFSDHKKFYTVPMMLKLVIGVTLVELMGPLALHLIEANSGRHEDLFDPSCPVNDRARLFMQCIVGTYVFFGVFTYVKLRRVHDAYMIKRIIAFSCVYSATGIALTVMGGVPGLLPANEYRYLFFVNSQFFLFHNLTWQVIQSFLREKVALKDLLRYDERREKRLKRVKNKANKKLRSDSYEGVSSTDSITQTKMTTLKEVLEVPAICMVFTEHLKREFSVENLLFYKAATKWAEDCRRGMFSGIGRNIRACEIYCEFVDPDADLQVNLKGECVESVLKTLTLSIPAFTPKTFRNNPTYSEEDFVSDLPDTMFDSAVHEIYRLMEKDSFIRFQRTPLGKQLIVPTPTPRASISARSGTSSIPAARARVDSAGSWRHPPSPRLVGADGRSGGMSLTFGGNGMSSTRRTTSVAFTNESVASESSAASKTAAPEGAGGSGEDQERSAALARMNSTLSLAASTTLSIGIAEQIQLSELKHMAQQLTTIEDQASGGANPVPTSLQPPLASPSRSDFSEDENSRDQSSDSESGDSSDSESGDSTLQMIITVHGDGEDPSAGSPVCR